MYFQKNLAEIRFKETEELMRAIPKKEIAEWLLKAGFFPESHILPPTFVSDSLELKEKPYNKEIKKLTRRNLLTISYPKSLLSSRSFSIQHPYNYHDIVFYLYHNWESVLDKLFSEENKIYSYSIHFPVCNKDKSPQSSLSRSRHMVYEWIQMAENDMIQDAIHYDFLVKTDITNFYHSIYTHSIAWAIDGREEAFLDRDYDLLGNKIDKLVQYANDARTNGIPVGSALSDLIAEILLCEVDLCVSRKIKDLDFIAVRFKDDYRFLCKDENDGQHFLSVLSDELGKINLMLNERKTTISKLPDGLYRNHDREYFPYSLNGKSNISFKQFEYTLLTCLEIHRKNPGTNILENFLSELLDSEKKIKIKFTENEVIRKEQIRKFISLLFLLKRESEKIISYILSLIEIVYIEYIKEDNALKSYIKSIITNELQKASEKKSAFEAVWLIFFWRFIGLGEVDFKTILINEELLKNKFVLSMINSKDELYPETKIKLFKSPKHCKKLHIVDYLNIFDRNH